MYIDRLIGILVGIKNHLKNERELRFKINLDHQFFLSYLLPFSQECL